MLTTPNFPVFLKFPVTVMALAMVVSCLLISAASAETRTLRMYFTHTKESATITFKKNGRYVKSGLRKANRFLRDWRRKEPTRMDPELLDLVWEVYQKSGSRKPIHVISGYRSPKTNKMLRRRGRKVARTSQHVRGKALDFFMPDVSVSKLRALGLKAHRGGVGYYRGSFVHLDTGRVRHWPRMSRRQLSRVFPRGRTIHIPSNGKPLRGYKIAQANLKRGLAADGRKRSTPVRRSLLASIFSGGGGREPGEEVDATPQKRPAKKEVVVAKVEPKPQRKKPTGPDPFSLEATAAKSEKSDEAEPVVTVALTVPSRRPRRAAPAAPTELALASPPATMTALRPSADIPVPGSPAVSKEEGADELRARVTTALTRQSEGSAVQAALTAQASSKPASQPTQLAMLPTQSVTLPSRPLRTANPSTLAEGSDAEATKATEVQRVAKLTAESIRAATRDRLSAIARPRLRSGQGFGKQAAGQAAKTKPFTRPAVDNRTIVTLNASTKSQGDLALGNLDGRTVKSWAVATSTRVGPAAQLQAPQYRQGTNRELPAVVFASGFQSDRPLLRADRFSGKKSARSEFAPFKVSLNSN